MTSKTEINVIVSNGYQPLSSCWCPKSPGLASDKILLLSDESLLEGEDRKKYYSWKWLIECLSWQNKVNCQVDYFCVFFCVKGGIAKQQGLCKLELSNNEWFILTKLLTSVRRSLLYKGQWRKNWMADSASLPQSHIGLSASWKLCLKLFSQMTRSKSNSCNIFDYDRIMAIKKKN